MFTVLYRYPLVVAG